jgi:hypothetical protein
MERRSARQASAWGYAIVASLLLAAIALASNNKAAAAEKVLYRFCQQANCADGASPYAGLVSDAAGNLYGTTVGGGTGITGDAGCGQGYFTVGCGAVFRLSPNKDGSWTEAVLYSFCASNGCPDGAAPIGGLIIDSKGNLYGTTLEGGSTGNGVAFELAPNPDNTWAETVLHSFCPEGGGCSNDGGNPAAALLMDQAGNLYGTTGYGGAYSGGIVFELIPNQNKTTWSEVVLYNFCSAGDCADGDTPQSALVMDGVGNLYGTAGHGGNFTNSGVAFKLTPNRNTTIWTETVLHTFGSETGNADGAVPYSTLVMDGMSNLYGTTEIGGPSIGRWGGNGVVFELKPNQDGSWSESVLHSFLCSSGNFTDCPRGSGPTNLLMVAGSLYGMTTAGGAESSTAGVAFALMPTTKSASGWDELVLHNFCSESGCTDGANPAFISSNMLLVNNVLYGTTTGGGQPGCNGYFATGCGVVFAISP